MEMSAHKLFVPVEPDQVGVVPYRIRDGAVEFLLITSRKSRRWLIPKGNVEPEMGPRESARMEASEEAGISGELGPEPLGCYRHGRSKSSSVVEVFLLRVDGEEDSWLEAHERKRRWFPVEEAIRRVSTKSLKAVLAETSTLLLLSLSGGGRRSGATHAAVPPPRDEGIPWSGSAPPTS